MTDAAPSVTHIDIDGPLSEWARDRVSELVTLRLAIVDAASADAYDEAFTYALHGARVEGGEAGVMCLLNALVELTIVTATTGAHYAGSDCDAMLQKALLAWARVRIRK